LNAVWYSKLIEKYKKYLPLAIQFFLGGLSSAYIIYFSRSVSLSKTSSFFVILVILFFANEFFKKRILNIYLLFGIYSFVSFTFFAYMLPVVIAEMNAFIFIISGILSLSITIGLVYFIFRFNPILKFEVSRFKLLSLVFFIYGFITLFYFFKLIPPVPLALNESLVAYDIKKEQNEYVITYEPGHDYMFWRDNSPVINLNQTLKIFVFTSIFAPTDLNKKVYHKWRKYNPSTEEWDLTDKIGFKISGGRRQGFRGYTFKQNISAGEWEVEVVTEDDLIIGVVDFTLTTEIKEEVFTKIKVF
jgi:hypothetical protein